MSAAVAGLQRQRRKQDLLLASRLARGQAVLAFDELAGRADGLALQVLRVRQWLSSPLLVAAGGLALGGVLTITLRRVRLLRVLRWGWLAWRLWRSARRVLGPPPLPPRAGQAR